MVYHCHFEYAVRGDIERCYSMAMVHQSRPQERETQGKEMGRQHERKKQREKGHGHPLLWGDLDLHQLEMRFGASLKASESTVGCRGCCKWWPHAAVPRSDREGRDWSHWSKSKTRQSMEMWRERERWVLEMSDDDGVHSLLLLLLSVD
jgi:hypothetical protein